MSNNTNLSKLANVLADASDGQYLKSTGSGGVVFDTVAAGAVVYATPDLLPLTGNSAGDMAYVTSTNRFYINNGSGWYSVGLVNTNPAITSAQDASSNTTPFTLTTDGTATVITITASDPEEVPITYGYSVTSGSLTNGGGASATVTQGTGANINKFTVTPSTNTAYGGTFTLTFTASDGINQAQSANEFTLNFITTIADSKYTTLLAQAVGSNNGTNSSLTDSSSNNEPITNTGTPIAGTFSPYRGGGYSWDFEGSGFFGSSDAGRGESIEAENNASAFNVGTNDYSVEGWFKSRSSPSNARLCDFGPYDKISLTHNNSNKVDVKENGTVILTSTSDVFDGDWHFVQVVRTGGYTKLYIDGTQEDSAASTTSIGAISKILVGAWGDYSYGFDGQIADFRFSNTARTAAVPTERLTSDSNTKLLVCSKPYLVDESGTATSLGLLRDTSGNRDYPNPTTMSPFDSEEYDAADNGGSIYFDGSSGASFSQINLSSTYTVECWFYATSTDQWQTLFWTASPFNQFIARWTSSGVELQYYTKITHQTKTSLNTWNHAALVSDGTDVYLYLNGERSTNSVSATTNSFSVNYLGYRNNGEEFTGNIADARVIDGTAVYSGSSFTPPTSPLSSSGTTLHLKGTDASIIDKAQSGHIKIINNTTGSSTNKGGNWANTYSIYFDGAQDGLVMPINQTIGTGDFTIEAFVKLVSDGSSNYGIFQSHTSSTVSYASSYTNSVGFYLTSNDNNPRAFCGTAYDGASTYGTGYAPLSYYENTWRHIAVAREGTNLRIYVEGNLVRTHTSSNNISATYLGVGGMYNDTNSFKGNISDGRLTVGLARYTASDETSNIPTAPLEG